MPVRVRHVPYLSSSLRDILMSSLFTNNAAMTAQMTLKLIGQNLDKTNDVISTGLKIAGASDNAAYWAIATQIRQDNASLGAVKDSIGQGLGVVNITYQALNTMVASSPR
ncbi:hypothetical protein CTI14_05795 [Methylobacterium radiotolerans]|nr:hypothetical protein CTI14_05795 [Methylobacterium radiotolerans]